MPRPHERHVFDVGFSPPLAPARRPPAATARHASGRAQRPRRGGHCAGTEARSAAALASVRTRTLVADGEPRPDRSDVEGGHRVRRAPSSRGTRSRSTAACFVPGDRLATAARTATVRTWVAQLPATAAAALRSCPRPAASRSARDDRRDTLYAADPTGGVDAHAGTATPCSRSSSRPTAARRDREPGRRCSHLGRADRGDAARCSAATAAPSSTRRSVRTDAGSSPAARRRRACGTPRRASACTSCGATEAQFARPRSLADADRHARRRRRAHLRLRDLRRPRRLRRAGGAAAWPRTDRELTPAERHRYLGG